MRGEFIASIQFIERIKREAPAGLWTARKVWKGNAREVPDELGVLGKLRAASDNWR